MESYVQLRWLCSKDGEFQEWCYPEAEPSTRECPKCGRKVTTLLARCAGKCTWFEPYCTKPRKKLADWVRGGRRANGRSTGRPRKKPLNNEPYKYEPPKEVEILEED